jgi:uncharacterized protein YjcR
MNYEHNYIKEAVYAVGGPTRVANKLGVASSTVHAWIKKERVANYEKAQQLAALSAVAIHRLRGF